MEKFSRTSLLIGEQKLNKLKNSTVAVFGVGGVGGFCAEALCRSGVGTLYIFDGDVVDNTNINRQLIAITLTVGKDKVEVFKNRALSINEDVNIIAKKMFVLSENIDEIDFTKFDYVVDAVDTVSAKIAIICKAKALNIPVISCMGTGGKTNIKALEITDVYKTKNCPLSKVMRRELSKRNIKDLTVIYSSEIGVKAKDLDGKRVIPSSIFVPGSAGLLVASKVVQDLTDY